MRCGKWLFEARKCAITGVVAPLWGLRNVENFMASHNCREISLRGGSGQRNKVPIILVWLMKSKRDWQGAGFLSHLEEKGGVKN